MKKIKPIFSMLLALCLLCGVSAAACAHEVPDEDRKGTVTVEMKYNGSAVSGGVLTAYRVGEIQEDDGDYSFVKTDAMEGFTGSYEEIDSAELAGAVAAFVQKEKISAYSIAGNQNGKAVFSNLELGLYLIAQTESSDGYEPLTPFLVSVPMNENGTYLYEINAEGKVELTSTTKPTEPTEPTEPKKPKEPTLPQTGQLNWPVPVLAILGMALFLAGWALRFGRR
ncbi:MAG: SpaA isopeptide-forming pilin-related protein [Eubacteriales bacterium]|nr:SpaA isopeptide-forming pilin-related protein [Eubacteriales bacterium]